MKENEHTPLAAETLEKEGRKIEAENKTAPDLLEQEDAARQIVQCLPNRNLHGLAPLGSFMLEQQFNPDYFNWTEEEKKAIEDHDTEKIGEILLSRLVDTGAVVLAFYIVDHDKDVYLTTDGKAYAMKADHFHAIARFKLLSKDRRAAAATALTLPEIAQTLGVEKQYIEKPKSGRYSWDNFRSYLIHAKDPDKYQYDPTEVLTIRGKPYIEVYGENKMRWQRGIATKKKMSNKEYADWLIEQIDADVYNRDEILKNPELRAIYMTNPNRFDIAARVHAEVKALEAIEALKNGEFEVSVFFLQGESNGGKSTFMNALVDACIEWSKNYFGKAWRYYDGATTNALDDYEGQEIVTLDDIRGTAMKREQWLNLVDPKAAKRMPARYRNKRMAARVIIITCPTDPVSFFMRARSANTEGGYDPVDQFLRRLQMLVRPIYIANLDPNNPIYGNLSEPEKEKALETARQKEKPYGLVKYERVKGAPVQYNLKRDEPIRDSMGYATYEPMSVLSYYRPVRIGNGRYTLASAVDYALEIVKKNNTKSQAVEVVKSDDDTPAEVVDGDYEVPEKSEPENEQVKEPEPEKTEPTEKELQREYYAKVIEDEWKRYFDRRNSYLYGYIEEQPTPPMYRNVDEYYAYEEQKELIKEEKGEPPEPTQKPFNADLSVGDNALFSNAPVDDDEPF